MIDAVIFDFDDTLVDFEFWIRGKWANTIKQVEYKIGIKGFDSVFWKVFNSKSIYYHYMLDDVLNQLHIDDSKVKEFILNTYRNMEFEDWVFLGVFSMLNKLRSNNIKTAIITNGPRATHAPRMISTNIDKYMDHIEYAPESKTKPSVQSYLRCMNVLNVQPSKCIYVGNDYTRDLIAPEALGMKSVLFNKHNMNGNDLLKKLMIGVDVQWEL
jgi:putative hydrolase of the HAD superfamily